MTISGGAGKREEAEEPVLEGSGGMMISRSGLAKSCWSWEAWRDVGEEARRRLVGREERREVEVGMEEGSSADIFFFSF